MRRAKIVATLGPATEDDGTIDALIGAGVDVFRLNLSHGDRATHEAAYASVRRAAAAAGRPVGILADLQGPKIRLGAFADGAQPLAPGDDFTITTEDVPGTREIASTTYAGLAADVAPGDTILIDDGRVRLRVIETDGVRVHTVVVVGGTVSDHKGINLPGVAVSAPALTAKDESDVRWALALGVDLIALSFVRSPKDVLRVQVVMAEEGRQIPVIAKIERPEAVDRLQEIIDAFDGVMVARGDLGVELALESVPIVQKHAIELARRWAKPVIVATQMLESMIEHPVPTRAETSDVANAVIDGADAVMLSGETSVGAHPVATVETMARIIASTEDHGLDRIPPLGTRPHTQGGALTLAALEIAEFVDASYLCVFSHSGDSVRRLSRLRHGTPIIGLTDLTSTQSQLALVWGVQPYVVPLAETTDGLIRELDDLLRSTGHAQDGDHVVVIAGAPPGTTGSTNNVRVHVVGGLAGT
ncbi:pyruvate kinase [Microbacterium sp. ASV49]|uniref:Pyruvate kinase n=1 Tax=Microbacterium candidum TaxID=3041922 RepID=A0ABT7MZT8_9MICO|nr:pyruvate kinase [Microbacterium sp. ASV49]MDL9979969.1 pyruvate kinase [Microbacterium sp. ASV49]